MADTLSGLLQGLNQGVQTGLQLYTAVEGQKRANRQEELQAARYAVEDQRYADEKTRQASRDAEEDDRWEKTYDFNNTKMIQAHELAQAKMRQELAIANDNSRRGWAGVSARQQSNKLAADKFAYEKSKETKKTYKAYSDEVGKAFADPDRGVEAGVELINSSPAHRLATVTKFQQLGLVGEVPPEVVGRMTLIPTEKGQYAIGLVGEDGSVSAYDPDGVDGPQKAVTVPASMLQRAFGGQDAVDVGTAQAAVSQGRETVGGNIADLAGRARTLSQTVEASAKTADEAAFAKEFEETGPRATWLSQQRDSTTAQDTWAGAGGTVVRTNPSTGKRQADKVVDGQLQNPEYQDALQEHQATLSAANSTLSQAQIDGAVASKGAAALTTQARTLANAGQEAFDRIGRLPVKERAEATANAVGTLAINPALAQRYPGESPQKATELFTKDRDDLIKRVTSAVDLKTQTDAKGKPMALKGGEANLRSVMLSMPPEMTLALNDYTGQMEGALTRAAQGAAEIGKPEAIPYLLYADKLGIDSKGTVALMQDKALWDVKDPADRFKYASQAMDLVKAGGASSVEAALGKVMMGR